MIEESNTIIKVSQPKVAYFNIIRASNGLFYVLAAIPALVILVWILLFTAPVPFWDEWEFITLAVKLHTGGFSLNDFWIQHNEHRIVVLRLIALGLAAVGGWDALKEVLFSFLVVLLTCVVTWQLLKLTIDKRLRAGLALVCSLLIFSTVQYENWLWGFQMAWFIVNLLLITAVWVSNRWPGTRKGFFLALGATCIATYTSSMAIPIWFCILVGMIGRWGTWRIRYIIIWIVSAIVSLGLYFYNFTLPTERSDIAYFLNHPLDYAAYILNYLATPWLEGPLVPVVSLGGLIAVTIASLYLWWVSYKSTASETAHQVQIWYAAIPWLIIVLYVLFNAAITVVGRIRLGVEQAHASRYTTLSIWYWVASFIIIVMALQQMWQRQPKFKPGLAATAIVLSLVFLGLYSTNYLTGYKNMEKWHKNLAQAIPFLYDYPDAPDTVLLKLFPSPPTIRQYLWTLDQYHESIFRPQQIAERKNKQETALALMNNPAKKLYTYPTNLMFMTAGDTRTLKYNPDTISFMHRDNKPVNIFLNTNNFDKQKETASKSRTLYIHSDGAWYANIYWDTGKGLSENEKDSISPFKDAKGQLVFVVNTPVNLQNFRVDLYYNKGYDLIDTIKVDMYEAS